MKLTNVSHISRFIPLSADSIHRPVRPVLRKPLPVPPLPRLREPGQPLRLPRSLPLAAALVVPLEQRAIEVQIPCEDQDGGPGDPARPQGLDEGQGALLLGVEPPQEAADLRDGDVSVVL